MDLQGVVVNEWQGSPTLVLTLDRLEVAYQAVFFALAAMVLWNSYRKCNTPILRQQMKWISGGTILAMTPYTLFYVLPFLSGSLTTPASPLVKISALSLVFLPLTFGYAIVRYRLMDVDIIVKRGVAYTLATPALVGAYFVVIASLAEAGQKKMPSTGTAGLIAAIIVT